ncbi:MAG: hypothetical protein IAE97_00270 [Chthoniobacterales bacterium]|nr:hypothetical protein [Chthoniobacterales bacterium]
MSKKKAITGEATTEVRKENLNLQYKFSDDELRILGKELAEAQIQSRQLEDDRKRVADEWKAKISTKEAEIASLSNKVNSGYEYRDIPCEITLNEPVGKKTARRTDTGETVWVRDLTDSERQRTLDFSDGDAQQEAGAE